MNLGHRNTVYVWSGSSFASAVATAVATTTQVGGNAALTHSDVSNLTFVSNPDNVGQSPIETTP